MSFQTKPVGQDSNLIHNAQHYRCYQCFKSVRKPMIVVWKEPIDQKINLCTMSCFNKFQAFESAIKELREGK